MKGYTIQHSIDLLEKAVENGGGSGGGSTAADITYDNTSSGLTADDVQEAIDEIEADIKAGIVYTSTERKIGTWYDGNDLFEKIIPISAFPDTPYTPTSYEHGISDFDKIIDVSGVMNFSSKTTYPINMPAFAGSGTNPIVAISVAWAYATATDIVIQTAVDRSGASGYVKLTYTKVAPTRTRKKK